ncbi:MAG: hypothetical protein HY820_46210 [Acidobacteria bacterium]|nr:hypothetical protein [Acidobacteriota bacterium]
MGIVTAFQAAYHLLSPGHPHWGEMACLPWDEEVFGFPVADLRMQEPGALPANEIPDLRRALEAYARESRAELISMRIPASHTDMLACFMQAGFYPVDLALEAASTGLREQLMLKPRFGLRLARPEDHADILRLAGSAFEFGRYHTDPRFPRELANRRYARWVENALGSTSADDRVFVMRSQDKCVGFYHAVLSDGVADLRLAAASPSAPVGLSLYCEALLALQQLGGRRYVTKVSAANMGVMNIYASIGFRFSKPEYALHWHSPCGRHLR